MSTESSSIVDLNVGGVLYTTSLTTLTKVNQFSSSFSIFTLMMKWNTTPWQYWDDIQYQIHYVFINWIFDIKPNNLEDSVINEEKIRMVDEI